MGIKKIFLSLMISFGAIVLLASCTKKEEGPKNVLQSITLDTSNAKTTYKVGEEFSSEGLVVTALYTSGTSEVVTGYEVLSDDFKSNKAGSYSIGVKYTLDEIVRTQYYTVKVVTLKGIEVFFGETEAYFKNVTINGTYDYSDIVVKSVYGDESRVTLDSSKYTIDKSKVDFTTKGSYEVKISYTENGITQDTFFLVVVEDKATNLDFKSGKLNYIYGESIDYANLLFTITYESGKTEDITGDKLVATGKVEAGKENEVNFTYSQLLIENNEKNVVDCAIKITVEDQPMEGYEYVTVEETHTFDAEVALAALEKSAAVALDTKFSEDYFTLGGTAAAKRANSSTYSLELSQGATNYLEFTTTGNAEVVIKLTSTGATNESRFALTDSEGNVVENAEKATTVTGATGVTFNYTLKAGTYRISSPADENYKRGVRVISIVVNQKERKLVPIKTNTVDYTLNMNDLEYEITTTISADTKINDQYTLKASSSKAMSVYVVETPVQFNGHDFTKILRVGGATSGVNRTVQVTVNNKAKITIYAASTSAGTAREIYLANAEGAKIEGLSQKVDEISKVEFSVSEAGTYLIGAGANIYIYYVNAAVEIDDTPKTKETTYTFDAEVLLANYEQEAPVARGLKDADEFFEFKGDKDSKRSKSSTFALDLAQDAQNYIEFTITGTAVVTLKVSSTGKTNVSPFAIVDAEGNVVANNESLTTVTGTSATTVTYTLAAGTYKICSPTDENNKRGCRIMSCVVVETTKA